MTFSERLNNIKSKRLASEAMAVQQSFEELSNFSADKYLEENYKSLSKEYTYKKIGQVISAGFILAIGTSIVAGAALIASGGLAPVLTGALLIGGGVFTGTIAFDSLLESSQGLFKSKNNFLLDKAEEKINVLKYHIENGINEKTTVSDFVSACKETLVNSFKLSNIISKFKPLSTSDLSEKLTSLNENKFSLDKDKVLQNIQKYLDVETVSPKKSLKNN